MRGDSGLAREAHALHSVPLLLGGGAHGALVLQVREVQAKEPGHGQDDVLHVGHGDVVLEEDRAGDEHLERVVVAVPKVLRARPCNALNSLKLRVCGREHGDERDLRDGGACQLLPHCGELCGVLRLHLLVRKGVSSLLAAGDVELARPHRLLAVLVRLTLLAGVVGLLLEASQFLACLVELLLEEVDARRRLRPPEPLVLGHLGPHVLEVRAELGCMRL
mmetsp:Transcript_12472/g.37401  ORF Transcript_12472/g.37401 Transcript_12472/m.37401 type:complete len:220 (-) Transcript_12472:171-830(-)